jgi:hypothetical protein
MLPHPSGSLFDFLLVCFCYHYVNSIFCHYYSLREKFNLIKRLNFADRADSLLIRQDNRTCTLAHPSAGNSKLDHPTEMEVVDVKYDRQREQVRTLEQSRYKKNASDAQPFEKLRN